MPSVQDGGRHSKTHYHCLDWHEVRRVILEALQKVVAECENVEERMEMTKRKSRKPTQWKPVERRKMQSGKVGVRKAQKLVHASRRLRGPRGYRRVIARKSWKVESFWLGRGAA